MTPKLVVVMSRKQFETINQSASASKALIGDSANGRWEPMALDKERTVVCAVGAKPGLYSYREFRKQGRSHGRRKF